MFEGANTTILWLTRWVWAAWSCLAETGSTRAGTGRSCCLCLRGSRVKWWRGWWRRWGRWAGGRVAGRCKRGWHWQCFPYRPIRATRPPWCIPFGRPIPHRVGKHGLRSPQGIVKSTKTKLDVHQFHLIVKLHKGRNYLTWIPLTLSLAWTTLEQRKNQRKNQRTHNIDDACTVDILLNLTLRFGIKFKTEWLCMLPQILDIKAKPHHNDQKSKNLQKVQEYPGTVIYIYIYIYLSIYLFICLFVCLYVYMYVCII